MVRKGTRAAGGFLSSFRDFIMRGNVVDLAVAVVIGAAFSKIIDSLVGDIITPAILNPAMQAAEVDKLSELSAGGIQYGLFLAAVINFLVIAFCIYILVQAFEKAKRKMARQKSTSRRSTRCILTLVAQERLTESIKRLTNVMEAKA
ncbi:MAG: large conductance mechanosensitive channel protein MscL [Cyanobacteria bacterium J06623_7]